MSIVAKIFTIVSILPDFGKRIMVKIQTINIIITIIINDSSKHLSLRMFYAIMLFSFWDFPEYVTRIYPVLSFVCVCRLQKVRRSV